MRSLTIFIPGLFGSGIAFPDDLPNAPALNWFLKKGFTKLRKLNSFSYALCDLFGLKQNGLNDLPIASISRLIDSDQYPDGVWVRVDPVHVSTNGNRLKLLDSSQFNITQHDALEVQVVEASVGIDKIGIQPKVNNRFSNYAPNNAVVSNRFV